ncbi:MAG: enoyl-CoA hydratase [Pseudomonadota bacterium]
MSTHASMAEIELLDTGTDELRAERQGHVVTLTLNRPDKRNALSDRLTPALRQMLFDLEADGAARAIVITGAGSAFCAGGDVSGMGSGRTEPRPTPEQSIRRLQHRQETLTLRLHELTLPTIAALPGPAVGAGLAIALACDLRVAAASAFVTTGYARIGLPGDYGINWLLTHLVGTARARELMFTSRRVMAEEALALGLVNEVVPDDELRSHAQTLAARIAAGPPVALAAMKEHLNRAMTSDLRTCLAAEAERLVRTAATQDHQAAVEAFMAKRPPEFTGR